MRPSRQTPLKMRRIPEAISLTMGQLERLLPRPILKRPPSRRGGVKGLQRELVRPVAGGQQPKQSPEVLTVLGPMKRVKTFLPHA